MPTRSHKCEKAYRQVKRSRRGTSECAFCDLKKPSKADEIIQTYNHFWLIKNIYPYDMWDDQNVIDHIMLTPMRHVESIGDMNSDELVEYAQIVAEYEKLGYSVYARSFKNSIKSVPHQHTHFIKLDGQEFSFLLYTKNPHILIKK